MFDPIDTNTRHATTPAALSYSFSSCRVGGDTFTPERYRLELYSVHTFTRSRALDPHTQTWVFFQRKRPTHSFEFGVGISRKRPRHSFELYRQDGHYCREPEYVALEYVRIDAIVQGSAGRMRYSFSCGCAPGIRGYSAF